MQSKYIKEKNIVQNSRRLEIMIAQLYCISLPFRSMAQFSFLKSVIGSCANYLPFFFHVIGLMLWVINEKGKIDFKEKKDLVGTATKLMIWLNCSSILMAIVIQSVYGNHGSENAFQGIAGMLLYFVQYLFMFLYNYRVFRLLSVNILNRLLHILCIILLAIGYMQVFVMNGLAIGIYNGINFMGLLNPPSNIPKLCLTGIEGASAGCVIGVFVIPYLFSRIIMGKRKLILEAALWLIPLYYTFSSTAYILFVVDVGVLIFLLIVKSDNQFQGVKTLIVIILCVAVIIFFLVQTGILNQSIVNEIQYLLFEKSTDSQNGSTVARTVPLLVNWGAFTEYPVFGVGNGLQGYFYESYFPSWAMNAQGSDVDIFLQRSREEISNGGIFIPSLLSGYGIVGCCFILFFVWKCIKNHKGNRFCIDNFYYLYILAGIAFIVMGFQGDAYGLYFAWFMLSIPFMTKKGDAVD